MIVLPREIGIDIGTSRTRIYIPYRGIVFDEPSVISFYSDAPHSDTYSDILCIGDCSEEMRGRAPGEVLVKQLVINGAIQNQEHVRLYLTHALKKVKGVLQLIRSDALINIPVSSTSMENRTFIDTCRKSDLRNVYREHSVILAAFGVGTQQDELRGRMVADIGAGITEVGVISFGGINSKGAVKIGGDDMDQKIVDYVENNYNIIISIDAARKIKEKIGSVILNDKPKEIRVKGGDLKTKLPRTITVTSNDVAEAVSDTLEEIIGVISRVFQDTPPELISDIIDRGIILTGGLSNLLNIDKVIERAVNAPVYVAEKPEQAVIRGIGRIMQTKHISFHKNKLLSK